MEYYLVYKTINLKNGKYYIGVHKTKNKNDSYLGSGMALKRAIKKYGKQNFSRSILQECSSEEDMYAKEKEIIKNHINDKMCYNLNSGGFGGWAYVNTTGINKGINNCMHNKEIADKVARLVSATKKANPKYIELAKRHRTKLESQILVRNVHCIRNS